MININPWQSDEWERLQALRKRLPHGLLFKGSKGIGKLNLALSYAQSLLCETPDASQFACGKCPSCHWFSQGSHPDFRFIQPEALSEGDAIKPASGKKPSKQISVDQIRGLSDFFGMTAHQGGKRVVILHPAEAMNTNAANALLKNLEEPPQGLLFILVSHKPQQLLPTILSRCQSFALPTPDATSALRWLKEQGVADPDKAFAASGFSPLLALQLGEQVGSDERKKLLRAVSQPDTLDAFSLAEVLQKTEQVLVVQWLQQWCYDMVAIKMAGRLRYHPGEEAAISRLVKPVSALNLSRLQSHLKTAKRESQHTLNPKLFFESLLLTYRQLMLE
ncbi:MAG: DNA polymerase III subunit delta' [Gallionella sp.]